MVLSVGDIESIAMQRDTLRTIESRFIKCAVSSARFACADRFDERAVELCDNDAVVI